MKIFVVDTAASSGGALSILRDYYESVKLDKKNKYVFLLNDNYFESTDNIEIIVEKKYKKWINRLLLDFIVGKKIVKRINPDEIFSLQNTIIRGVKTKQVLYVHQPLPFQKNKKFSFFKKNETKLAIIQYFIGSLIISSIKRADKVIVQTNWMKKAIIEKCNVSDSLIFVEKPKIVLNKRIKALPKKGRKCIFFYPASNIVYKNHNLVYKAVEILNNKKVSNFEVLFTIDGINTDNIKYIGNMSRNDVFEMYHNSILVFPSYIETFGLPLLEARECGSIILASDTDFSHEILDDYDKVFFFNPFDEIELSNLMLEQINSKR